MGKIVSYTTEELEAMPDLTDWARVRAMTDEEIEAVDTSDEGLGDNWIEDAILVRLHGKKVTSQEMDNQETSDQEVATRKS